jgi:pimeloyl-ACP methyl ester carboxylesterase
MLLHTQQWGNGNKSALLVHGMSDDSNSWRRVGPILADKGYKVIAADLRGNGDSLRMKQDSLQALAGGLGVVVERQADVVIAHSLGGLLVAMALETIQPKKIIYVEPAWSAGSDAIDAMFRSQKTLTFEQLQTMMSQAPPDAVQARFNTLQKWDVASLQVTTGFNGYMPAKPLVPTLIVLADPSLTIDPAREHDLEKSGFTVRHVAHTGHVVYNDDLNGFMRTIEDWF